ncbi:hypothetical protein [Texcoconibacillus texcoconensis]|uniref:Uncharacterized protein n=1 Tax=Texcoconibacillus texcoconensis TaxID=1095777 RepID=A0A840QQK7_9BACI|nr:hypothetical protein [Texcoconibacillus texcoconensis]MBB5173629.1 hypothetical protein [Texcoconibacillus texcoconensis]
MDINQKLIEKHKQSLEGNITSLLDSIAKEEKALAKLIESEADNIDAFIGDHLNFPTEPSNQEILDFNKSINKLIDSVLIKQWILFKKVEMVVDLQMNMDSTQIEDKFVEAGLDEDLFFMKGEEEE